MAGATHEPASASGETLPRPRSRARRSPWLAAGVLLLLVAALVIRLALVSATPGYVVTGDARDYDVHARSIAAGHGFSRTLAYGRPTAFRPPGYPYFLAGVYLLAGVDRADATRRVHAARVAQAIVGTVIVALVGLLAAQLGGAALGLVALGLAAVYVPLITVGGSVMSEPLFAVFMLGALAAAMQHRRSRHRYRYAVLAGVLGGLAILTRANALVLLLPLAIAAWDARPRLSRAALGPPAVLCVVALLVVTPWTVRNAREFHTFVPVSTQLGSALAGTYNDAARADTENPASWRALMHVPDYTSLFNAVRRTPEPVLERKLRAASFHYIGQHPGYVADVAYWNTVRTLDLAGLHRSRATAAVIGISRAWADAGVFCFWLFAVLAVAGGLTPRARRTPAFVWSVPALMFLSVVFLVVETPRYRTAIDPFIVILAAMALCALPRLRGRRDRAAPSR
ncbi:MAG: phospholipid carrier-dependent glycosyltransferase [Solirubrobacterales bacterium]|nr:phospholipid carrier-dependent glycosyltransferase [Solirubrobacterales bacterium]